MVSGARRSRQRASRLGLLAVLVVALVAGGVYGALWLQRGETSASGAAPEPKTKEQPVEDPAWGPTDDELAEAKRIADGLSLEELAGQLIIARHFSNDQSLALVRDQHFAGVMVTGDRILDITTTDPLSSVTDFNQELRHLGRDRGVPVMIPIDQEGGLVARLKAPLTEFPTFMSAGAAISGDPERGREVVKAAAFASGAELKNAGFNTVFAPGGDVTVGIEDPIIGTRSAGSDPQTVAQAATAAIEGYSEAGIISSVKHFPGHNVNEDSHRGLPDLDSGRTRLREHDLVPFVAAIEEGAPSIMTGHLDVTFIDKGTPASMSRKVIVDGLRDSLGYDGLVVTDSLGMGAVMSRYPGGEAAVESIKAGNDVALMPADNQAAYDAMLEALETGDLPEDQARASAARTIAWVSHAEASAAPNLVPGTSEPASKALSAAALTVVEGECRAEPATAFRPQGSAELVQAFNDAAADAGVTVRSGPSVTLLGTGSGPGYGDYVVTTDRPYALEGSNATTAKLALFGAAKPAMAALIDYLTGKTTAPGRLPVDGLTDAGCSARPTG